MCSPIQSCQTFLRKVFDLEPIETEIKELVLLKDLVSILKHGFKDSLFDLSFVHTACLSDKRWRTFNPVRPGFESLRAHHRI